MRYVKGSVFLKKQDFGQRIKNSFYFKNRTQTKKQDFPSCFLKRPQPGADRPRRQIFPLGLGVRGAKPENLPAGTCPKNNLSETDAAYLIQRIIFAIRKLRYCSAAHKDKAVCERNHIVCINIHLVH